MKRRDFLSLKGSRRLAVQTAKSMTVTAGLEPYSGPWEIPQVTHLLRRTMFGAKRADCDYFLTLTPAQAIQTLVNPSPIDFDPLINDYNNDDFTDPEVPFGESWLDAGYNVDAEGFRILSLKGWWIRNIMNQEQSLEEKMLLFWHNHIPIQFYDIFSSNWNYHYLQTLRQHQFGNFKALIKAMTLDRAMLHYLNGQYNSKWQPDENYARELQELFCIGKGPDAHFTEGDVQAAARVLTGWRVNYDTNEVYFDDLDHDTDDKQFSAFYNNVVISGQTGQNGKQELDELIDMLLDNDEAAKFLCRKLYRFFVSDHIDVTVEENIIIPLAELFRNNNYEIRPVVETLIGSQHFFDVLTRGGMIKSPLDMILGIFREFEAQLPSSEFLSERLTVTNTINYLGIIMQQDIGDPPNVAGWQAYYQFPVFDKSWVNTDTLPKRAEFTDWVLFSGIETENHTTILNLLEVISGLPNPADPNILIDDIVAWMYGIELAAEAKTFLKSVLLSGQVTDSYWTNAWFDYESDPSNEMFTETVYSRLRSFFYFLLHLEEYQLS